MRGCYVVRWNNDGRYADFLVKVEYENADEARRKVWKEIRERGIDDKVMSVSKMWEDG